MPDLEHKLAEAAKDVGLEWSDARARRVEGMMLRRKARRAQVRAGVGVALALACGFGALQYARTRGGDTVAKTTPAPTSSIAPVTFVDGSTATPLLPDSVVETKVAAADRVEVILVKGAARFEITKNPARTFRVTRGATLVEVLGTGFSVEPAPGGTQVTVHHGRVRVTCHGVASELALGDKTVCLDAEPTIAAPSASASASASVSASVAPSVSASVAVPAWRTLAHDGEYDKAWTALAGANIKDEPNELLLAADVARLSHHAAQAVPHLKRVVEKFPGDPRAPLAAFTLGRVQMEDLGAPKDAAASFAKTRALGATGTLAEDALAREAEAWWRAGDSARARTAAEDYVAKYPKGLRVKSVKKFGGLE
ncbi:MAG: FecR domain-containing protein [Myxococcales bacterium]|nr:FecR domain-containing protein [Myxococcales bacterium]